MGRIRRVLLQYPASTLVAVFVFPVTVIWAHSLLATPPEDNFVRKTRSVSGFTLESAAPGLPYSRYLGRFAQQNLSPLRALRSGFDWIQVDGRVYKSTYPARGFLYRPEFVADNDIVVREEFSGRLAAKWVNSLTTDVVDGNGLIARRVHWSTDTQPHPDNSRGTSVEFVADALGVEVPSGRQLSVVPVRVVGAVSETQERMDEVHYNRERAILYGCDERIRPIDSHVTRGVRGDGWEYTTNNSIAAVFCQDADVFIYYDPSLDGSRVTVEWLKIDGAFVANFDFYLRPGRNERRKTPSWISEFSFDGKKVQFQVSSGWPTADYSSRPSTQRYTPVVTAFIEIDVTGADFRRPLTNGEVERPDI